MRALVLDRFGLEHLRLAHLPDPDPARLAAGEVLLYQAPSLKLFRRIPVPGIACQAGMWAMLQIMPVPINPTRSFLLGILCSSCFAFSQSGHALSRRARSNPVV